MKSNKIYSKDSVIDVETPEDIKKQLKHNGNLFSSEEMKILITAFDHLPDGRIEKKTKEEKLTEGSAIDTFIPDNPHSVIKLKGELYGVLDEVKLGEGAYGKVKFIQRFPREMKGKEKSMQ